ncbi:MAG: hypothetical protein ACT4PO_05025 [Actinomycetota bacterium]
MERIEQKGYAAAVPEASGPLWSVGLRLTNQWLHLSAAGVAIGAALFQRIIMVPRLEEAGATPDQIARAIDGFYSLFPWIQLGIFVTTGFFNYLFWLADTGYAPKESLRTPYVKLLIVKVLLANVLLGLGIVIGFVRSMQENPEPWLTALIVVGLVIVLISASLRRSPTQLRRAARPPRAA